MSAGPINLTGVWHGLYTYSRQQQPVYFVATLIDSGGLISGTTHESEVGMSGAPLTLHAGIEGMLRGQSVEFTKTYDGSAGWHHRVAYEGTLNGEHTEIEGRWSIGLKAEGRFLMIRSRGVTESVVREVFERV